MFSNTTTNTVRVREVMKQSVTNTMASKVDGAVSANCTNSITFRGVRNCPIKMAGMTCKAAALSNLTSDAQSTFQIAQESEQQAKIVAEAATTGTPMSLFSTTNNSVFSDRLSDTSITNAQSFTTICTREAKGTNIVLLEDVDCGGQVMEFGAMNIDISAMGDCSSNVAASAESAQKNTQTLDLVARATTSNDWMTLIIIIVVLLMMGAGTRAAGTSNSGPTGNGRMYLWFAAGTLLTAALFGLFVWPGLPGMSISATEEVFPHPYDLASKGCPPKKSSDLKSFPYWKNIECLKIADYDFQNKVPSQTPLATCGTISDVTPCGIGSCDNITRLPAHNLSYRIATAACTLLGPIVKSDDSGMGRYYKPYAPTKPSFIGCSPCNNGIFIKTTSETTKAAKEGLCTAAGLATSPDSIVSQCTDSVYVKDVQKKASSMHKLHKYFKDKVVSTEALDKPLKEQCPPLPEHYFDCDAVLPDGTRKCNYESPTGEKAAECANDYSECKAEVYVKEREVHEEKVAGCAAIDAQHNTSTIVYLWGGASLMVIFTLLLFYFLVAWWRSDTVYPHQGGGYYPVAQHPLQSVNQTYNTPVYTLPQAAVSSHQNQTPTPPSTS